MKSLLLIVSSMLLLLLAYRVEATEAQTLPSRTAVKAGRTVVVLPEGPQFKISGKWLSKVNEDTHALTTVALDSFLQKNIDVAVRLAITQIFPENQIRFASGVVTRKGDVAKTSVMMLLSPKTETELIVEIKRHVKLPIKDVTYKENVHEFSNGVNGLRSIFSPRDNYTFDSGTLEFWFFPKGNQTAVLVGLTSRKEPASEDVEQILASLSYQHVEELTNSILADYAKYDRTKVRDAIEAACNQRHPSCMTEVPEDLRLRFTSESSCPKGYRFVQNNNGRVWENWCFPEKLCPSGYIKDGDCKNLRFLCDSHLNGGAKIYEFAAKGELLSSLSVPTSSADPYQHYCVWSEKTQKLKHESHSKDLGQIPDGLNISFDQDGTIHEIGCYLEGEKIGLWLGRVMITDYESDPAGGQFIMWTADGTPERYVTEVIKSTPTSQMYHYVPIDR